MGRKKKKPAKPWCWYCNREFDDEKILIQHQKAKHFKCHICHKKLYTGPGLAIHCMQVHKESIDKIPNALPNRNSVDIEVYGMEGIPEGDVREHECKKGDIKPILPVTNVPPAGLLPGLIRPGMPPLPFMMPPIVHGLPFNPMTAVPPPLPNTAPQLNLPGHPPPPPLNRPPLPLLNTSQLPQAPNQPPSLPLPSEPLFSAAITSLSSINNTNDSSSNNDINKLSTNGTATNNINLIISPPNSKIIHPEEDISLEEFRCRLPKYNKKNELNSSQNLISNFVINSAKLNNISQQVSLSNNFSRNTFSEMNNDNISQPLYSTPNGPPPSKPASFQSTFRPTY